MKLRHCILLLLTGGLTACVNLKPQPDTMRLYVLGPVAEGASGGAERAIGDVYIARPNLPTYLQGNHIQYRTELGELKEISDVRWAEPLNEGITRALGEWLSDVDDGSVVRGYPWPQSSDQSSVLRVEFQQFGANADGLIQFAASWRLENASGTIVANGTYQADAIEWESGNAQSLVLGLNAALKAFAEEISANL